MSKEAMKLAQELRALADRFSEGWHEGIKIDASDIVLLSDAAEALAEQPAQPPECQTEAEKTAFAFGWFKALESVRKRPAQQEPKKDLMYSTVAMQERHAAFVDRAVATLEQAKREALAEQPAQQEPAGWRPATFHRDNLTFNPGLPDEQTVKFWKLQGVEIEYCYASPPAQRTWVGLTDEEILEAWCIHLDEGDEDEIEEWQHVINEAREIEAKLREKNQ